MSSTDSLSYSYILGKAWPIILANAAVPILGLVDTAVIGNVGTAADLGAIAFGALIFSFVYWGFGFLRMGTTGFVAQAAGAGRHEEVRNALGRALLLAVSLGLILIALQWPIRSLAFTLLGGSEEVEVLAMSYYSIRIWGAPATLATFALMGLLVGLGNSRQVLLVQLFLNGLNIILDIWLAGVMNLGVRGIALGTVIAEWSTVMFAGVLIYSTLTGNKSAEEPFWDRNAILDGLQIRRTLVTNLDIMIRTLILVFSFAFFINQSAQYGELVLAANHILLQLISFSAFFLDGYAFVVESLVGKAVGARDGSRFDEAVKKSTVLAAVTALMLAIWIWIAGDYAVALLTDISLIRIQADEMIYLAAIYVLFSFAAFQLDGIFIGASSTQSMRNAAVLSLTVFLLSWWWLAPRYGVYGLWWAMIIYVAARADALLVYYPGLRKKLDT